MDKHKPLRSDRANQIARARAAIMLALAELEPVDQIATLEIALREEFEAHLERRREEERPFS
jgi:hypothetical protein